MNAFTDLPSLPPDAPQRIVEAILIKHAGDRVLDIHPYGAHWVAGAVCDALRVDRRKSEAVTDVDASLVRQLVDVNTRLASALEAMLNADRYNRGPFVRAHACQEATAALDARLALTVKLDAEATP